MHVFVAPVCRSHESTGMAVMITTLMLHTAEARPDQPRPNTRTSLPTATTTRANIAGQVHVRLAGKGVRANYPSPDETLQLYYPERRRPDAKWCNAGILNLNERRHQRMALKHRERHQQFEREEQGRQSKRKRKRDSCTLPASVTCTTFSRYPYTGCRQRSESAKTRARPSTCT